MLLAQTLSFHSVVTLVSTASLQLFVSCSPPHHYFTQCHSQKYPCWFLGLTDSHMRSVFSEYWVSQSWGSLLCISLFRLYPTRPSGEFPREPSLSLFYFLSPNIQMAQICFWECSTTASVQDSFAVFRCFNCCDFILSELILVVLNHSWKETDYII